MNNNSISFGKHFKEMMEYFGYAPVTLSKRTGITDSTIRGYMDGKFIPSYEKANRIATAFGCDVGDIYNFEKEQNDYDEGWRPSRTYSDYELNTNGQIRNIRTGRTLKTNIDQKGYERVTLRKDNRSVTRSVHQIMGDTFFDEDEIQGNDIYHKNLNRSDNRLDNLAISSKSETSKRGFATGNRKGRSSIRVMVNETGEVFESIRECARALDIQQTQICKCLNGYAYKAGGYTFTKI